jgi:PAS domain S-box-containing protein
MVEMNEELLLAIERLTKQTVELANSNERLKLELAEQKCAADSIRESAQGLRTLAAISTDLYWEQDTEYRFLDVSSEPGSVKTKADPSAIGQSRWDLPGSVALSMSWDEHRALLDARQPIRNFEYSRVQSGSLPSYFSVSGVPVFDQQDHFLGYRGTKRDITARKQAETALRASEARYRTVVAALGEAVILRDADGRIVDCNASAERIFGKTLAQMKGFTSVGSELQILREDGSLMPMQERPSVAARRTGLAQSDSVVCYRMPAGRTLWALINVQPLFDESASTPSGFVSTITDISKLKRGEMEIVKLNVELENRVLRRTAQLQEANKELEAFSYSVAHDLRAPLSTIGGYCALLRKKIPLQTDERVWHYLDRIRSGVLKMGEITDGLLSLAHLSRSKVCRETVDLSADATSILNEFTENDAARVVQTAVEPGLVVLADRAMLRQVLSNLLANAWKFSSKKSCTVISVGQETGADQLPLYYVRDNGAGFDMAHANQLFGTFQRLHSPEEFAGSGIGLATVKRIIDRHQGKVWAISSLGEGSTFYFTLSNDPANSASLTESEHTGSSEVRVQLPSILPLPDNATQEPASAIAGSSIQSNNDAFSVSDQQFSISFEHSSIGMALSGIDSRGLRVNKAFCKMLGYSEAELLARPIQDATHPDDIEWDELQAKGALAGEIETYQREKRYLHKSGRIVWASLTCSLVRDTDRRPLYFISQIQDITERKEAEQTLRQSEAQSRALAAVSSDWFWEQDENFRFVMVSSDGTPGTSDGRDNFIGNTRWELDDVSVDRDGWVAHKAKLERHEVFRDFEITRVDHNGRVHFESISGVPIFDASGRFTGYCGIGRDITEMHLIADALRTSELLLQQITNNVPALLAYVDVEQRFRFHNRAYEDAFGLSFAKINGQTLMEVLGQQAYEDIKDKVEEVLRGYPIAYESLVITPQGNRRNYAVQFFPRYGKDADDGKVIGFYSLATDITEYKRIDLMKNEFISTVSHELRTPLTAILGSLGLVAGGVAGALPPAVKTLVGIARGNCERLIRLINDILDIEKIESDKMRVDLQLVDLRPLVVQTLAANEGYGVPKNVTLSLHFSEGIGQVNVDSDRLIQVITNLLSNAMKFSPPGKVVEVKVSRSGIGVRVEVCDHGPGVPEDFRSRIFQKFSQADSSDTRQSGGSGLGLSISRLLVEKMGGTMGFLSEAGAGATFFFELPECKTPAPLPQGPGVLTTSLIFSGTPSSK